MLCMYHRNAVLLQHFRRYLHGSNLLRGDEPVRGKEEEDHSGYVYPCSALRPEIYFNVRSKNRRMHRAGMPEQAAALHSAFLLPIRKNRSCLAYCHFFPCKRAKIAETSDNILYISVTNDKKCQKPREKMVIIVD